jgi:hypothetical protein
MVFLLLNFRDVSGFFRDYIGAGYSTPETNFADNYVTIYTNIGLIFMAIINIFIYIIFMTKKKNSFYHLGSTVYYLAMLIIVWVSYTAMGSIEAGTADPTFINFVRDLITVGSLPMYFIMIVAITKMTGFNIKTFRFDGNADLKIREDDEENVELKIGSDDNSFRRNSVHMLREIKYYVLENKFVFTCIGVVLALIVLGTIYMNFRVYNRTYSVNQAFKADDFTISLKESYIATVNYRGDIITANKYYLAIKIGLINNGKDATIDSSVFALSIGDKIIYPSYDKASHFIDIGKIYQGETIRRGEANEYVFVYELEQNQIHNSYKLKILNSIVHKEGSLKTSYKILNVKPKNITKQENMGDAKIGAEINLKDTTLGKTTFKLISAEVASIYTYEHEVCYSSNNCRKINDNIVPSGGNALLVINDELKLDDTTQYYKNSYKDFYADFVTIRYEYSSGNRDTPFVYTTKLKNVTPQAVTDKKIYEVQGSLARAEKIEMIISIRNKYVTIKVK